MGQISSTISGARPAMSIASSRARSRPTYRCSRPPSSKIAKAEFEASWKQWKAWAGMEEVP